MTERQERIIPGACRPVAEIAARSGVEVVQVGFTAIRREVSGLRIRAAPAPGRRIVEQVERLQTVWMTIEVLARHQLAAHHLREFMCDDGKEIIAAGRNAIAAVKIKGVRCATKTDGAVRAAAGRK